MTLPPPAATLARVDPAIRLGLAPAARERHHQAGAPLHVLVGDTVTRCGARTSAAWQAYPGPAAPALRLCRRCLAGLPLSLRTELAATRAELRAVHEHEARDAAVRLSRLLADLREAALVDGSAYERTTVVEAALAPRPQTHDRFGARTMTRRAQGEHTGGHVATERGLSLLELLNELDPNRPDVVGRRLFLHDPPALGTPVDAGATYDPRLWMGRSR
jgi:hypothetical protein